jgi:hypothetical protein
MLGASRKPVVDPVARRGGGVGVTDLFFPEPRRNPRARIPPRSNARGVLTTWLAPDGSQVRVGQRVAAVRMLGDSAEASWVSALANGTLWHQVREGEVLTSGVVVGLIE